MLATGGRPVEQRVLDEHQSKLAPAHEYVSTPIVRRSGVPDGQVRQQHFIVPVEDTAPDAPRVAIDVTTQRAPAWRVARFVRSGTTRGPPQA